MVLWSDEFAFCPTSVKHWVQSWAVLFLMPYRVSESGASLFHIKTLRLCLLVCLFFLFFAASLTFLFLGRVYLQVVNE